MTKVYIYLHCDLQKTYSSMETPEYFYPDTPEGREKLLEAIDNDAKAGYIAPTAGLDKIREEIRNGRPEYASDLLDYAYIRALEQAY